MCATSALDRDRSELFPTGMFETGHMEPWVLRVAAWLSCGLQGRHVFHNNYLL